jgi:TolB-like protein/tetratricopeptide (TPR) repeat protein
MSFCLDDGSELLFGPARSSHYDEPATAILSEPPVSAGGQLSGENSTKPFIRTSAAAEPQGSLSGPLEKQSFSAHRAAKPLLIALGLVVIVLGGYFGYRYFSQSKQINSIAVMPFVNESGSADVEYLSDGMTESLISSLSQLPNLTVKPRSSVFRYKGKETDPQTVGKELNVQAILNGRVMQRGQDVSLFVELIDISLDKVVWSETYNRKQSDIVTLQSDIARDVSSKIKTKLSGADVAKVTKTYTTNPEAYQLYLKGNFYMAKYDEEGYKKALEYYNQAIAVDPKYALAYHGIAVAYDFANDWYLPPREAEPKAKAAATKALELDETLAETHYLLGKIIFWYEWDWVKAEREWTRANELDPALPALYPIYLAATGRYEEAIQGQQQILQRAPLDLLANQDMAGILLAAGKYDRSIEQSRKALEIDPNYWWSYQTLGLAYQRKKQYPEAIAALERARLADPNPAILGNLGYVYATAGKKTEAQTIMGELKELSNQRYVSPYHTACIYAGLGNKDQAFEWLERSVEERASFIPLLKFDPVMEDLRSDPRFKDLLKRMNLPE